MRRCAIVVAFCAVAAFASADQHDERPPHERVRDLWRRDALLTLRVASSEHLISDPAEIAAYREAGFNALVVFDVEGSSDSGTAWRFKTEETIRAETDFARAQNMPLIIGLAVEPVTSIGAEALRPRAFARFAANSNIPGAADDDIQNRIALWKTYGDDIILGVFPWYDDVFLDRVPVDRQHHVYRLVKSVAHDWYVFGMIGEFGFNAGADEIAQLYDPAVFDHLIVLMYPFNLSGVTRIPLDDTARYVDRYVDVMNEKYFSHLRNGQLLLVVVQAFNYTTDIPEQIPRAADIDIMSRHGGDRIRTLHGQEDNYSAAYFYWGGNDSLVGIAERSDWRNAIAATNADLDRQSRRVIDNLRP